MSNCIESKRLPPGPQEGFASGHPETNLPRLVALFEEYGDIYKVHSPARDTYVYVVSHPDHVKHVLVTNHRNYTKGVGIDRVKILLGNGIMVSEGEQWRAQRRMIQPFFQRQEVARFCELMTRCNLRLLARWEDYSARGEKVNVTTAMSEVTLQIILSSIFSEDLETIADTRGTNPFAIVTEETSRDLQFARKFRALGKLVLDLVGRRRRESRLPFDFLSMLMKARDKKTAEPMSDKALVDEVMTLIVAGHETTASALNWIWYLLSQHRDAEAALHRELAAVCRGKPPAFDDLPNLVYTRQVIEEALRLYPPGWLLTRRAIAEDRIGIYDVAPKTDVFISPYIIHRHPQYWESPDRFMPQRFAGQSIAERHRYAYLPFAVGPRHCVGEFFAMVEMQLHVALMAQRFRLTYLPERPIELEPEVNLRTKHSLFMMPERRD